MLRILDFQCKRKLDDVATQSKFLVKVIYLQSRMDNGKE